MVIPAPSRRELMAAITQRALALVWLATTSCVLPEVMSRASSEAELSTQMSAEPIAETVTNDAGFSSQGGRGVNVDDAALPKEPATPSTAATAGTAGAQGAGGDAAPVISSPIAGASGTSMALGSGGAAAEPASKLGCPSDCGVCSRCAAPSTSCTAWGGMDDPNGCSGARSCTTTGHCLYIDQQMPVLSPNQRFADTDAGFDNRFVQVVTFAEPGTLEEVRALLDCTGANLPVVSIKAVASDGTPLEEVLAGTSVKLLNKQPETSDQLHSMTLDRPLVLRRGQRLGIEVFASICHVATNAQMTYAGGALYLNGEEQPGSLVFQTLVER